MRWLCVSMIFLFAVPAQCFLDYIALGKNDTEKAASIGGIAEDVKGAGCALIGGRQRRCRECTRREYDIAGFAVG